MKLKCLLSFLILASFFTVNAQNQNNQVTPANIIITPQNPLPVKDSALRDAVVKWSEEQLKSTDYKKIKAHPSSDIFPGKVKDGYEFIGRTIKIDHKKISDSLLPIVSKLDYSDPWTNTMYSTGLYAVPGQYIEIVIPKDLKDKDLRVQIGCHSDRLNQWVASKEAWRRMPIIIKNQKLKNEKTRLASPFGGLIYITASPKSDDWNEDITINHAVSASLYQLGTTTQQEWEGQLKNNKAPWGELATDDIIISLPDSVLQKVTDPEKVMKLWNLIIGGEMDLAQIPQPFYRAQRLVVDEHIGGGFMHSGYPIMVHHSPVKKMFSENIIANPELLMHPSKGGANWGFFHEIGHNMQNLDWVFGGTTEVSCNFFSIYMFDRLMGGRDDAHNGISNTFTQKAMKKYLEEGADYDKWKKDPFLGLIMFRQLQEGFGWETFKKFFREYQAMSAKDPTGSYADTDQKKRDLWVKTFSTITKRNIAPFFEKWGIPISDEVKNEVSKYAIWMPYNFPPVN
ncbi:MAG TPA: M60 family metallopeptidase [Hanamia sp.]